MSGHYPWPKDPEGYSQERPTASPDHQVLNALAGPGRPAPERSFWPSKTNLLKMLSRPKVAHGS